MDTKTNGEFNFEDLPVGSPLMLRVSSTGYKSQDLSFRIIPTNSSSPYGTMPTFDKDLGTIKLSPDVKTLGNDILAR